jgi:hypothetical protein
MRYRARPISALQGKAGAGCLSPGCIIYPTNIENGDAVVHPRKLPGPLSSEVAANGAIAEAGKSLIYLVGPCGSAPPHITNSGPRNKFFESMAESGSYGPFCYLLACADARWHALQAIILALVASISGRPLLSKGCTYGVIECHSQYDV